MKRIELDIGVLLGLGFPQLRVELSSLFKRHTDAMYVELINDPVNMMYNDLIERVITVESGDDERKICVYADRIEYSVIGKPIVLLFRLMIPLVVIPVIIVHVSTLVYDRDIDDVDVDQFDNFVNVVEVSSRDRNWRILRGEDVEVKLGNVYRESGLTECFLITGKELNA